MLKNLFSEIRTTYFPRWDKEWQLSIKSNLPSQGKCDNEHKRIIFQSANYSRRFLEELIIHEICHAIAYPGHGNEWQQRMMQAARKARSIG